MRKTGLLLILFFSCILIYPQTKGIKLLVDNLDKNYKVGKQYLLTIGIDKYEQWPALKNPVKDTKEIKDIIQKNYYIDEFFELYDKQATKANIIKLFKDVQNKLEIHDSLLIFYAGHGHFDKSTNTGFWIPVNAGTDVNAQLNWLPNTQIRGIISNIKAIHVLLISDSCFSGDILNTARALPAVIDNAYFKKAYGLVTRQVLTSGASETVPDESSFARQLKLTLRKNTSPYLDPFMLYNEIRLGVKTTTPLFGNLTGTGHQEGGSFLLFAKETGVRETTPAPVTGKTVPSGEDKQKTNSLPVIHEILKIPASVAGEIHFQSALAVTGDSAVIGAPFENKYGKFPGSGAAYIFQQLDENSLDTGIKVTPDYDLVERQFGCAVSITDGYCIIGARGDVGSGTEPGRHGAAYIYSLAEDKKRPAPAKLFAPDGQEGDNFGWSVAMSGEFAIIGAPEEDGGPGDPLLEAGAAYVYGRNGWGNWILNKKLTAADAEKNDQFGWSVAVSFEHTLAGAPFEDGGRGNAKLNAGAAYLYTLTPKGWIEQKISAPDAQAGDQFGCSLSIDGSGGYIIIGAPEEDGGQGDPLSNAGAAYIYRRVGKNNWDDIIKLTAPEPTAENFFGRAVAIYNEYALVGSNQHTYLFLRSGANSWKPVVRLEGSEMENYNMQDHSLAVNDRYALIGVRREPDDMHPGKREAGSVFVFDVRMDTIQGYLNGVSR